jgi:4-methyl-5(b-hydroxyethyl)-thiazole monophosphate biosynthesis
VVDGNVITSRGMGTAIDFSLSIIKKLLSEDIAKKLADNIMYRHY